MADEYRGLYVEFRGDSTELVGALTKIERESRETTKQLMEVERALKLDSKSPQLLAERLHSLSRNCETAHDKVETLRQAQEKLGERTDDNAEAYDRLSRDIAVSEAYLKRYRGELTKAVEESGKFSQASVALENMATKWRNIGEAASNAGRELTTYVTLPLAAAAAAVVTTAVDIDSAWYGVRKTVEGSEAELQRLKDTAIEMSQAEPISATTILNIMELGGQLGIATQNLEEFATVVAQLDVATNLNADEAATSLAQFANITKMTEQDYDKFASTIVHLGNNTATTEADILEMAKRIASAGTMAGFAQSEILGISAALASTGMAAEAGGSAVSTAINLSAQAVAAGALTWEEYSASVNRNDRKTQNAWRAQVQHLETLAEVSGKTKEEFIKDWKNDAPTAFMDLLVAMGQMQDESGELFVKLDAMGLGSIRSSDAMRRLAGDTERTTNVMRLADEAWRKGTYAQEEFDKRSESLASKMEVLKNRGVAMLEAIGRPLADALLAAADAAEPLIQSIADVVQSFADMDEEQQRQVFMWAGIAAAAGPVLTIFGKLSSVGAGAFSFMANVDKSIQSFSTAMRTTNADMVEYYRTSGTLSAKLGLVANSSVNAAGGAKKYTDIVLKANKAQRDHNKAVDNLNKAEITLAEAEVKLTEAQENGAKSTKRLSNGVDRAKESLKKASAAVETTEKNLKDATKQMGAISTESSKTSTKVKGAFNGMNSIIKSFGESVKSIALGSLPMLAIAAATYVAGKVVQHFKDAKKHSENLDKATNGLRETMERGIEPIKNASDGLGKFEEKARESTRTVEDLVAAQADMVDAINETFEAAGLQVYELDQAREIIKKYANESGLSAEEQGKLRWAIDKVNELCGTQYSVVDASRGMFKDEAGVIQENTDKILANIEAREAAIRAQAYLDTANRLSQQIFEIENEIADTEKRLDEARRDHEKLQERLFDDPSNRNNATALGAVEHSESKIETLEEKLAELRQELETNQSASSDAMKAFGALTDEITKSSVSITAWADSNNVLKEALQESGISASTFARDLEGIGVTSDQMATLSEENLRKVVEAYLSNGYDIKAALESIGEDGEAILSGYASAWASSFGESGEAIVREAASMSGRTVLEFKSLTSQLGLEGEAAILAFSTALKSGDSEETASEIAQAVQSALSSGDYNRLGTVGIAAYTEALRRNGVEATNEAMDIANAVVAYLTDPEGIDDGTRELAQTYVDAIKAMGISTEPAAEASGEMTKSAFVSAMTIMPGDVQTMAAQASMVPISLATGMSNTAPVSAAKDQIVDAAVIDAIELGYNPAAQSAVDGFTGILSGAVGKAKKAASDLASGATNGISGVPDSTSKSASDASSGFAKGLINSKLAARTNAIAMAGVAAQMNNNASRAYGWGTHLGSNFASGISAMITRVKNAASSVASAAKRILGFSVPEAGPWSGSERGGYTSGAHLVENFASGMRSAIPEIRRSAELVAYAMEPPSVRAGWDAYRANRVFASLYNQGKTELSQYNITIDGMRVNDDAAIKDAALALAYEVKRKGGMYR